MCCSCSCSCPAWSGSTQRSGRYCWLGGCANLRLALGPCAAGGARGLAWRRPCFGSRCGMGRRSSGRGGPVQRCAVLCCGACFAGRSRDSSLATPVCGICCCSWSGAVGSGGVGGGP